MDPSWCRLTCINAAKTTKIVRKKLGWHDTTEMVEVVLFRWTSEEDAMASTNAEKSEPVAPQLRKTSELWEGDAFADLRRQMERVFQDFSKSFGSMPETIFDRGDLLDLRVDVQEADDHYEISAELPGLDQKDVELSIDDRVLTIKGEKKLESEREEK